MNTDQMVAALVQSCLMRLPAGLSFGWSHNGKFVCPLYAYHVCAMEFAADAVKIGLWGRLQQKHNGNPEAQRSVKRCRGRFNDAMVRGNSAAAIAALWEATK